MPIFYQRRWATPNGSGEAICTFRRVRDKVVVKTDHAPGRIGFEIHTYSVTLTDGSKLPVIEDQLLKTLDDTFAKAFEALERVNYDFRTVDIKHVWALIRFGILCRLRHPHDLKVASEAAWMNYIHKHGNPAAGEMWRLLVPSASGVKEVFVPATMDNALALVFDSSDKYSNIITQTGEVCFKTVRISKSRSWSFVAIDLMVADASRLVSSSPAWWLPLSPKMGVLIFDRPSLYDTLNDERVQAWSFISALNDAAIDSAYDAIVASTRFLNTALRNRIQRRFLARPERPSQN